MKRLFFSFFCLFCFLFSLLFPQICISSALLGIRLWFSTLLPSLFPAMVLSSILVSSSLLEPLLVSFKKFWHSVFSLTPFGASAFLFGILCGFPMGAKTTADLYQSNKISKQEACYLLTFSAFPSPSFLTGYLSFSILENQVPNHLLFFLLTFSAFPSPSFLTGYLSFSILENQVPNHLLFFIFFLSAFLTSLFFRRIYSVSQQSVFTRTQKETSSSPFAELLDISIMNSLFSITKLGGYIILFSVFQGILQFLLSSSSFFSVMLCGLTEFSTGLNALKDTALPFSLKFPLTMGFSSFGGLCVLAQTSCVLSGTDLPLFPYLIGRIVCTLIASGLTFLFVILF